MRCCFLQCWLRETLRLQSKLDGLVRIWCSTRGFSSRDCGSSYLRRRHHAAGTHTETCSLCCHFCGDNESDRALLPPRLNLTFGKPQSTQKESSRQELQADCVSLVHVWGPFDPMTAVKHPCLGRLPYQCFLSRSCQTLEDFSLASLNDIPFLFCTSLASQFSSLRRCLQRRQR